MNISIKFGRITKDGVQVLGEKSWETKDNESETAHTDAANSNREEG